MKVELDNNSTVLNKVYRRIKIMLELKFQVQLEASASQNLE